MKKLPRIVSRLFLSGAWPRTRGRAPGLPVDDEVEVARDRWGIPHISARTTHDLFFAQGYVHAQDRLWQMETLRRLTAGRLAEVADTRAVPLDWFARMSGMPAMKRRVAEKMSAEERAHSQAYADGVNACTQEMGRRLPVEFRSMRFSPEPWTAEDCVSVLPYLAFTQLFWPWAEKLLAVSCAGRLSEREWNDMFPSYPGAHLPHDDWFARAPELRFGALHPGALAYHGSLTGGRAAPELARSLVAMAQPGSGSNNWTAAKGEDGRPILANDPHLGARLPPVWYFCHLRIPGVLNVDGATLAGSPGVIIGRTERVAWGLTNFMLDAVDVLTYRVDPDDPFRYFTRNGPQRMQEKPVRIGLPHGRSVTLPLYLTEKGPVVTSLEKGVNAAAVMRWYGTIPDGPPEDLGFRGVFAFMKAGSAAELLEAAGTWKYVSMNFVAADIDGHIGWHVSGAAPVRTGYTGRLPGDASAGADWNGFHPFESLPHLHDPPEGFLATANYRPEKCPGAPVLSNIWCAPYRYRRIVSELQRMLLPGVKDFQALQMDVHSGQADRILPLLDGMRFADTRAREAASLLAGWDREVQAESAAAAVYELFITELIRVLLGEKLDDDLALYFNAHSYGVENEILERPESPFWNGDMIGTIGAVLASTIDACVLRMGANRRRWSWGRLHRHTFRHPGANGRLARWLLNPQPTPADGDCNTINVSWSNPSRGSYRVTSIPSMRMIAALGDPDGLLIIGPLGQSGHPGHRHYDDMTRMWQEGNLVRIPLTEEGVRRATTEKLVLSRR
ncbi:MAG: penicillin acylase family protein [Spirochaetia bacterium]